MKNKCFVVLLLLVTMQACGQDTAKSIELVTPGIFYKAIGNKKVQLIDIRTPEEYNSGHLEKAVNIDFYNKGFITQMNQLNKNTPIYIYCHSGGRSGRAAKQLTNAGFSKVIDLKGGIVAWKKDKKPLVK